MPQAAEKDGCERDRNFSLHAPTRTVVNRTHLSATGCRHPHGVAELLLQVRSGRAADSDSRGALRPNSSCVLAKQRINQTGSGPCRTTAGAFYFPTIVPGPTSIHSTSTAAPGTSSSLMVPAGKCMNCKGPVLPARISYSRQYIRTTSDACEVCSYIRTQLLLPVHISGLVQQRALHNHRFVRTGEKAGPSAATAACTAAAATGRPATACTCSRGKHWEGASWPDCSQQARTTDQLDSPQR